MNSEPPRVQRIAEDDRDGTVIALDAVTAAGLQRSGLVQVMAAGPGRWRLLPCGKVGVVRAGELDLVVTPKVGITRLLFLLGYAANPGFRSGDVQGIDDLDLLPALAETLCRQMERALGPGVLQGYVTRDDALTVLRGRPRLSDQFARRPGMLLPLEVSYDEYSADITENRLLRSAIRRMLTVPRLPLGKRARLGHLDGRLDGVQLLNPGVPLPTWRKTRLNLRYQSALRLAELVLRHQSLEVGPGGLPVAAFVVDMAKVFEDFVTAGLKEALACYPGRTHGQFPTGLDPAGRIRIRPDVVHTVDGTPRFVVDAKYKIEDESAGYPNADYYQMLAYCTALAVPVGWLVYAQGVVGAAMWQVRNTGITIVTHPLNLTDDPEGMVAQVRALAHRAWESDKGPSAG